MIPKKVERNLRLYMGKLTPNQSFKIQYWIVVVKSEQVPVKTNSLEATNLTKRIHSPNTIETVFYPHGHERD